MLHGLQNILSRDIGGTGIQWMVKSAVGQALRNREWDGKLEGIRAKDERQVR